MFAIARGYCVHDNLLPFIYSDTGNTSDTSDTNVTATADSVRKVRIKFVFEKKVRIYLAGFRQSASDASLPR